MSGKIKQVTGTLAAWNHWIGPGTGGVPVVSYRARALPVAPGPGVLGLFYQVNTTLD